MLPYVRPPGHEHTSPRSTPVGRAATARPRTRTPALVAGAGGGDTARVAQRRAHTGTRGSVPARARTGTGMNDLQIRCEELVKSWQSSRDSHQSQAALVEASSGRSNTRWHGYVEMLDACISSLQDVLKSAQERG